MTHSLHGAFIRFNGTGLSPAEGPRPALSKIGVVRLDRLAFLAVGHQTVNYLINGGHPVGHPQAHRLLGAYYPALAKARNNVSLTYSPPASHRSGEHIIIIVDPALHCLHGLLAQRLKRVALGFIFTGCNQSDLDS